MASRRKLRLNLSYVFLAMAAIALTLSAPHALAQDGPESGPLTSSTDVARVHLIGNDDIVRMARAGLGDDVLLQTIRLQPGHYDTNPDDLIALKKAGLSDPVIAAMEAHGTGLNVRNRPAPAAPAPTPLAMGIDEVGVYYRSPPAGKDGKQPSEWIPLHTERVTFKSGGTVKSLLTHGIVARDMNGHIDGAKSDLILPTGVEILIYAPAGTEATEYDFLRFREHSDNREFRTLTGGVFHSESGADRDEVEFHPKKIAPQMFTFTVPADIEKGEYGVLAPASAGIQGTGKIFTFSIRE